jgi:RNA polymerase sigma-70 factor (ECF subfamily)
MQKDMNNDIELVDRIKAGDEGAFNELIERYKRMGFSLAYNMTGSVEDAEDISQEAFAIVYAQVSKFRGESSFKTWFYRIVLNLCRRDYRKKRLASLISLNFIDREGEEREMEITVENNPETELSSRQIGRSIISAVRRLPLKQREVFVMKHFRGMKIKEISEVMECAEGTVKAHLFRAVKALQGRLKGIYNEM